MLASLAAMVAGILVLVWSADRFVRGAAATAGYAGLPPLVIGMVVVGFGTSAPELVVSVMAALDGRPELALGNALGSNIVNIGLILGLTALIVPLRVHSGLVRRELPVLLVVTLAAGALLADGTLSRLDGLVLSAGFVALLGWTLYVALRGRGDPVEAGTGSCSCSVHGYWSGAR